MVLSLSSSAPSSPNEKTGVKRKFEEEEPTRQLVGEVKRLCETVDELKGIMLTLQSALVSVLMEKYSNGTIYQHRK